MNKPITITEEFGFIWISHPDKLEYHLRCNFSAPFDDIGISAGDYVRDLTQVLNCCKNKKQGLHFNPVHW
ncbi:hypothetical protein ACFLQL_00745 [Verrucomicrobiota bacterium]